MLPFEDRYTRQRQLVEVGLEGQTRLEGSPCKLAQCGPLAPAAAQVAVDYLRRAGVAVETNSSTLEPRTVTHDSHDQTLATFHFAGPLHVATGALAALNHIRLVLGVK
jgi:hypothetical protein